MEILGIIVLCVDGVEEWDVRWIVCFNCLLILEFFLRVFCFLLEVRVVVVVMLLKKWIIDGMMVVNGVYFLLIIILYKGSVWK